MEYFLLEQQSKTTLNIFIFPFQLQNVFVLMIAYTLQSTLHWEII